VYPVGFLIQLRAGHYDLSLCQATVWFLQHLLIFKHLREISNENILRYVFPSVSFFVSLSYRMEFLGLAVEPFS